MFCFLSHQVVDFTRFHPFSWLRLGRSPWIRLVLCLVLYAQKSAGSTLTPKGSLRVKAPGSFPQPLLGSFDNPSAGRGREGRPLSLNVKGLIRAPEPQKRIERALLLWRRSKGNLQQFETLVAHDFLSGLHAFQSGRGPKVRWHLEDTRQAIHHGKLIGVSAAIAGLYTYIFPLTFGVGWRSETGEPMFDIDALAGWALFFGSNERLPLFIVDEISKVTEQSDEPRPPEAYWKPFGVGFSLALLLMGDAYVVGSLLHLNEARPLLHLPHLP